MKSQAVFEVDVPTRQWRGSPDPKIADAGSRARGLAAFWGERWRGALSFSDWTPRPVSQSARDYALERGYTITEQASDDLVRVIDREDRDVAIGRHPQTGALAMVILAEAASADSTAD